MVLFSGFEVPLVGHWPSAGYIHKIDETLPENSGLNVQRLVLLWGKG